MTKYRSISFRVLYILLSSILVLSACASNEKNKIPTPSLPNQTKTIETQIPKATKTPTKTPTLPLPTSTTYEAETSSLPTLSSDQTEKFLTNLIQKPDNCKLPCWWGTTPGITTWQEANDFLFHIGDKILDPAQSHETVDLTFDDLQLYQTLMIDRNSDTISKIMFSVEGFYNPKGFQSVWDSYSLKNILSQYGKPSRVLIHSSTVELPPDNKIAYQLYVFYDQEGFLIRYGSVGLIQNSKIHICPQFSGQDDLWTLDFYLQDPSSTVPLEHMVDGYEADMAESRSLEDATGLSIDQLMGLARGDFTCFDTPLSLW